MFSVAFKFLKSKNDILRIPNDNPPRLFQESTTLYGNKGKRFHFKYTFFLINTANFALTIFDIL